MLDHVSLGVSDLLRARRFYDAALRPLGMMRVLDFDERGSDYGVMAPPFGAELTITLEAGVSSLPGMHICFRAQDRTAVDEFHRVVLATGGATDGAPGLRHYHPNYYAAFVRDPDGHRIEAVCHLPTEKKVRNLA